MATLVLGSRATGRTQVSLIATMRNSDCHLTVSATAAI
jgi:hypothetical protein